MRKCNENLMWHASTQSQLEQGSCEMISLKVVVQGCSIKKVFLENPQNSQENTCARVSLLIKL